MNLEYVTTDGQRFIKRSEAAKHQAKIDAIREFADGLSEQFGLEQNVGINVAVYLAERPATLVKLLGTTSRRAATSEGANEPATGQENSPAAQPNGDAHLQTDMDDAPTQAGQVTVEA